MSIATSSVTIRTTNNFGTVAQFQGFVPWEEIQEACSFYNSELSKKLYPELLKEVQTSATKTTIPPIRLFDIKTKRFPIGLLQKVTTLLKEQGVDVKIEDEAQRPLFGFNFKWKGPNPHDYQVEVIDTLAQANRYGMMVAPTGSGKTLLGAKLIEKLGLRTLWIVHSADLVRQTAEFLKNYLGIKAGEFGAGRNQLGTVTVALAGASLKKALKKAKINEWSPGLVLVDELHRAGAYKTYETIRDISSYYRYGFSATPFRTSGDSILLEALFGEVVAQVSLSDLQEQGLLSKVLVETILVPAEERISAQGATWEEVYKPGIVEHKGRNKRIREKILELVTSGRQVLVDVDELAHIDQLNISSVVPETALVTGLDNPSEREARYNKFRTGELKVLVGTVLREGIDLPSASAVVLAGGKKSKIKVLQEIGRGLRTAQGKSECIVVDTIDQQHYLLFRHCQERFRTMLHAGFQIPEDAIRKMQIDASEDTDEEIERLKQRQLVARTKKQAKDQENFVQPGDNFYAI